MCVCMCIYIPIMTKETGEGTTTTEFWKLRQLMNTNEKT